MNQSILGVIGGLGPETGCKFCLNVNNRVKPVAQRQPHILLDNLPISQEAEERLINGGPSKEHFDLLVESIKRLNKLGASVIVIACNTVHVFIDELRKKSKIPILSIVEETAKRCRELNLKKIGILGSTKTIRSGLHSKELKKWNIDIVVPTQTDQDSVSECIIRIINHKVKDDDKKNLIKIIKKLENAGAEGIILGCTDLPLLINETDANLKIINTITVLEDASVEFLTS